ncbi:hypothetical protein [Nocardioides sp. SYSU DS0663]|uniref:hypothetical protein n=1 Tax=Nocardioides sp. SYSU DS0663 TaxID=3416445 RepID=UPI003F4B5EF0
MTSSLLPPVSRRAGHLARRQLTRLVPGPREYPAYSIVGAKRAGTTSLDEYLVDHPLVLRGLVEKGCRYYDVNYERGPAWFRRHLPPTSYVDRLERRLGGRPLVGESSPYYAYHPEAAARMAADVPGIRVFFVLRDPVQRAWSHHRYETARGFETLDFQAALEQEEARLTRGSVAERAFAHRHFSYLGRSRYGAQLERLHRVFGPEQVLVLQSERLFAEPAAVMARAFAHLGLEPHHQADYRAHKALVQGSGEAPLPPGSEAWLRERLADDRALLTGLVDLEPVWP